MPNALSLRRLLPWLIAYAFVLAGVVFAMYKARVWAVDQLATPKSLADWRTWRDDVREQQSRRGVVQRRVPTSKEPPALVMMRDHFGVSLAGAVIFASMLYWVLVWFVMGISGGPATADGRSGSSSGTA